MTKKTMIKYKQTIMMGISLLLIIAFFFPWVINNPELETFAYSKISMSGFKLFMGYQDLLPTLSELLKSLEMNVISMSLYLGYLLIVLPILGIVGIIMSGLRKKVASLIHSIHFIATFVVLFLTFITIMIFSDLRTMFFSIFGFGYGYYLSMLISGAGVGFIIYSRSKK